MRTRPTFPILLTFLAGLLLAADSRGQDPRFDLGVRGTVVTASGEPANDIMSYGVFGRYRLSEKWLIGAAVDHAEFDFERPWRVLGLEQDPSVETIDAPTTMTSFVGWIEREIGGRERKLKPFWSIGVGIAVPEVDDVTGPLAGGGTFLIETDAGTEIVASLTAGLRYALGKRFAAELAIRVDQHFIDWEVRDRVSGRTGSPDDYLGIGAHLGLTYRF